MITYLTVLLFCSASAQQYLKSLPEDGQLNFTGLAIKYGQRAEEYDVNTKDGYVLKLFHIIGDDSRPLLLIHGAGDSSDGFIMRGNLSLAVNLARHGYDVWAMNTRGNRYSRRHLTLDPDRDKAFWDFYVHEFGTEDLPTTIDFIAEKTTGKVSILGYSEGATNAFVLGATRPEYNDKVNVLLAMAPICYMHHTNPLLLEMFKFAPAVNRGLRMLGNEELGGFNSPLKSLFASVCNIKGTGYQLCVLGALFQLSGEDPASFEPDFVPVWVGHFPAGSSRKNFNHIAQIAKSKRFANYDYGIKKNLALYKSEIPPEYDLGKVTMKVVVLMGKNDKISTVNDVKLLVKELPNVVEYRVLDYGPFNHIDFLWGKTTYTEVLPQVLDLLDEYNNNKR